MFILKHLLKRKVRNRINIEVKPIPVIKAIFYFCIKHVKLKRKAGTKAYKFHQAILQLIRAKIYVSSIMLSPP